MDVHAKDCISYIVMKMCKEKYCLVKYWQVKIIHSMVVLKIRPCYRIVIIQIFVDVGFLNRLLGFDLSL